MTHEQLTTIFDLCVYKLAHLDNALANVKLAPFHGVYNREKQEIKAFMESVFGKDGL